MPESRYPVNKNIGYCSPIPAGILPKSRIIFRDPGRDGDVRTTRGLTGSARGSPKSKIETSFDGVGEWSSAGPWVGICPRRLGVRDGLTLEAQTLYDRLGFPGVSRPLRRSKSRFIISLWAYSDPIRAGTNPHGRRPRDDGTTWTPRALRFNDAVRESGHADRFPRPGTGRPGVLGAIEDIRAAPREEPGQAAMVVPRWADHRQQPDGRPPRLGPDLQGRLSALLRHDRPRAPLSERLRLPGPLGRGRGREGAQAEVEARHRGPGPRRPLRQHRPVRAALQGARGQVRRGSRPSNRSGSATGWTGTATRTGAGRRTSAAATSPCRRRTTTRSGASSRSATIAAWCIAATTPCPGVRGAGSA